MNTLGNIGTALSGSSGAIGSLLGTGAQMYGQQNAAEAIEQANNGAITNQQNTLGNIQNIYGQQKQTGNQAMSALSGALGTNGQAPDYSGFMNMPGYSFAVQQGTQTAERQAAAMGNAGNSGTAAMIGNQITGTAMQDYNTYIGQLQNAAGLGAQANQGLAGNTYSTGANISQLMSNTGAAQAGMYTGMGQTAASALNGSGVAGSIGSSLAGGIGNILGGSSSGSSGSSGYNFNTDENNLNNGTIASQYSTPSYNYTPDQSSFITDPGVDTFDTSGVGD
jgi:hypothetical protein